MLTDALDEEVEMASAQNRVRAWRRGSGSLQHKRLIVRLTKPALVADRLQGTHFLPAGICFKFAFWLTDLRVIRTMFIEAAEYLGSHNFVGRADELRTLNDWCGEADPNPMLLFEAIGGSGKSMLTWQWLNHDALSVRGDWAGRFWFSFYEKGAVMAVFCRHALPKSKPEDKHNGGRRVHRKKATD